MTSFFKKITAKVLKQALILISITLVILILFYIFNPRRALKLVFPDLNDISYINATIRHDSAITKTALIMQNKSPFKLTIDTINFEVILNDTSVAAGKLPLELEQNRFDVDSVILPLNLSIKKIKGIIQHLQDQDSTHILIKGNITYKTIFGKTKINFNKNKKIPVPKPPEIKILKVVKHGFKLNDKTLRADAIIEIKNKGKLLNLELIDIKYELYIGKIIHSSGTHQKPVIIKPQSVSTVSFPIELEISKPLKAAWLIGTDQDEMNYQLKATFILREKMTDKIYDSPVNLTATGKMELVK